MPVRQTRLVFSVISFGAILLWIMFGSYTVPEHSKSAVGTKEDQLLEWRRELGGMRHVLSASPEPLGLFSDDKCDMSFKNGTRINTDDAEVMHFSLEC